MISYYVFQIIPYHLLLVPLWAALFFHFGHGCPMVGFRNALDEPPRRPYHLAALVLHDEGSLQHIRPCQPHRTVHLAYALTPQWKNMARLGKNTIFGHILKVSPK